MKQPVKNNSLQIFVFGKLTVTLYRLNQNDENDIHLIASSING